MIIGYHKIGKIFFKGSNVIPKNRFIKVCHVLPFLCQSKIVEHISKTGNELYSSP